MPRNLTQPAAQWFRERNFTAIPIVLTDALAFYGYGDIRETPILYVLQYITPDVLTVFLGLHEVYLADFHAVWAKWAAKYIKGPINLNTDITGIERHRKHVTISYANPKKRNHKRDGGRGRPDWGSFPWGWLTPWSFWDDECWQPCSDLILAFPPSRTNLDAAGLCLTHEEEVVFDPVLIHNYYSSAVEFEGLPYNVAYVGASNITAVEPPPSVGQPVASLRL
ncbi:MAG: hypothetical protein INR71_12725, partial [Terriglobus roseus]|nr:hypothetical protein [Terriglobus roseus]